ncbi:MAG: peptide ABC transporter substrate-binding protein [Chlamydiia bacterium]|nr:peptide ABC transporter substrate-binding protein [Chlamydiia bacterium]
MDPHIGTASPSAHVIKLLYEGLMVRNAEGNLEYGLAERYEVSEDKKRYTFYLKQTEWSNGEPVTAYDFEYAWKKAILSPYYGAVLFSPIKNAGLCNEGKCEADAIGVYAVDAQTLVVELDHPTPYFLELTSCVNFAPINELNRGLTNGPFSVKEWTLAESLVLVKNSRYWDADNIEIPGVHFRIIHDESVRHDFFEKGLIDWIGDPLAPLSADAIESSNLVDQVISVPLNGMNLLVFNTQKYPFNNKNLRKALSYVISREFIAEHILTRSKPPALGLIPNGNNNYIKDGDRISAQLLFNSALAELGLTPETFPEIILSYAPVFYQPSVMHLIQQEWENVLGIRVKLDPIDKGLLYNQMLQGDFQVGSMFWVSMIKDPIYILDFFRSNHRKMNFSRWEDPAYQELMSLVDHEVNLEARKVLLEKAEAYVMDEMPVVPICFASALYMKNKSLSNIGVSPFMDVNIKQVTLAEE